MYWECLHAQEGIWEKVFDKSSKLSLIMEMLTFQPRGGNAVPPASIHDSIWIDSYIHKFQLINFIYLCCDVTKLIIEHLLGVSTLNVI